jgi:hypothetical protein
MPKRDRRVGGVGFTQVSERPRIPPPHTCGEAIEPDETDVVVEAEEVEPVPRFGGPADTAPRMRVMFHASHFPEDDPDVMRGCTEPLGDRARAELRPEPF